MYVQFMQSDRWQSGESVDAWFVVTGRSEQGVGLSYTLYAAVDSRSAEPVLIKAASVGSLGAAELLREQDILRRVRGAGVPPILDYGEDGRGDVLLILADPGGASLAEAWRGSDEASRLMLMERVCAALEAIHERGTVWGQVHPAAIRVDAAAAVTLMDASWASTDADPSVDICAVGALWWSLVQHEQEILPAVNSIIARALTTGRYTSLRQLRAAILRASDGLSELRMIGVGICSDTGMVRNANEDHHAVAQFTLADHVPCALYILSDGMGGEAGGVIASRITVETVKASISAALDQLLAKHSAALNPLPTKHSAELVWPVLQEAINQASRAVFERAGHEPALRRMGATVVIAVQIDAHLYVANVGDSRAYLVREGHVEQLTQDHTVVAQLIARGEVRKEEAEDHPARGQLIRNIGGRLTAEAHFAVRKLHEGDRFMLCCDGLTDMVGDDEIAESISQAPTPQAAADRLVNLANSRGGPDNITVIISQSSGGAR